MTHKIGKGMTGKHHSEISKEIMRKPHENVRVLKVSKEFLFEEYINKEKSLRQIGKELTVSPNTVRLELIRKNIKRRDKKDFKGYWTNKKNPKQSIIMKELFKQGKLNIILKKPLQLPKDEIISLYKSGYTLLKLSEKFNCGTTVLYKLLKKEGIIRKNTKKGEKNSMWGKHHSKETREKLRITSSKQIMPKKDTSIEVKIQNYLKQLEIEFVAHKHIKIKYIYPCDIFIPKQKGILQKTIIECDGDYWHGNPKFKDFRKYPQNIKMKRILDFERTAQLEEQGFRVIRLWENEIKPMELNKFWGILKLSY